MADAGSEDGRDFHPGSRMLLMHLTPAVGDVRGPPEFSSENRLRFSDLGPERRRQTG